ncbi:MAG: leucine-rich repeat domain-containing protein [Clostridia bacterium]|nr:leucine-rich repeat domain-containing protein [Clostridia bacterium]
MKKKILLLTVFAAMLVCLFAISTSAATLYKESADGEVLFSCTFEGNIVTEYDTAKKFPLTDENGNALTWYLTGEKTTDIDGNIIKYVTKALTRDVFNPDTGNYNDGKAFALTVVSANFDNDANITKFADALFGGISAPNFSTELLFVYIPDSVTSISYRFCQNVTSVLEIRFSENSQCSEFKGFFAWQAKSLREVDIPKLLKILPLTEGKYGQFDGCSRLDKVNFYEGCQLEEIGANTFANCNFTSLTLPNSVKIIGSKAFQGCGKLTYLNLGAGFTTFKAGFNDWFSFTFQVGDQVPGTTLTLVIPGNTITLDRNGMSGEKLFGYLFPSSINIQYAGTEEQYNEFVKVITETKYNETSVYRDNGGLKNSKVTFVNQCDAFYNGEHKSVEEVNDHNCTTNDVCRCGNIINAKTADAHNETTELIYAYGYAQNGVKKVYCSSDDCNACDSESVILAIFTAEGYAVKEDGTALLGAYKINSSALKEYNAYLAENGKSALKFGIVMSNANSFTILDGKYTGGKGLITESTNDNYTTVKYVISGYKNTEALVNLELVIALYVVDENGMSFVQSESDAISGKTDNATCEGSEIKLDKVSLASISQATLDSGKVEAGSSYEAVLKEIVALIPTEAVAVTKEN